MVKTPVARASDRFGVIVADPPWRFQDQLTMSDTKRGSSTNYGTMSLASLCQLDVPSLCEDECLLALWCPSSLLEDGLMLMKAWGFQQKQIYTWVKMKQRVTSLEGRRDAKAVPVLKGEDAERFREKVAVGEGCWEWQGTTGEEGYGAFPISTGRKQQSIFRAHRLAYALEYGAFDPQLLVCHRCDNPGCVRPDHLFLGTDHDNVRDCVEKGRSGFVEGAGHARPNAKITEKMVREIRELKAGGAKTGAIAEQFGISAPAVCDIVAGRTWEHVPGVTPLAFGLGHYFRGCSEHCLIGVRGAVAGLVQSKSERNVLLAPALAHSTKPDGLHEALERLLPYAKKLEMFARRSREGWICTGRECPSTEGTDIAIWIEGYKKAKGLRK